MAQEIWLCDNRTVGKYVGEINDFKMHLREQMTLNESDAAGGGGKKRSKAVLKVVPLAPKRLGGESEAQFPVLKKAPLLPTPLR